MITARTEGSDSQEAPEKSLLLSSFLLNLLRRPLSAGINPEVLGKVVLGLSEPVPQDGQRGGKTC